MFLIFVKSFIQPLLKDLQFLALLKKNILKVEALRAIFNQMHLSLEIPIRILIEHVHRSF